MNKYQEALNNLEKLEDQEWSDDKWSKTLKELVDKATPKKPTTYASVNLLGKKTINDFFCPHCKKSINKKKHCSNCGQKLDWSDWDSKHE